MIDNKCGSNKIDAINITQYLHVSLYLFLMILYCIYIESRMYYEGCVAFLNINMSNIPLAVIGS